MSTMNWMRPLKNLVRKAVARKSWVWQDEYAYYHQTESHLADHEQRVETWSDHGFIEGLDLLRGLGALSSRLLEGRRVLDLGAGESMITLAVASHFSPKQIWAVDAVPKQMWAAQQWARRERLPASFAIANAFDLPFPDASFDIVLMNGVVHHLPDVDRLFHELFRLAAPGGTVHCFEPNPTVWIAQMHHEMSDNERAVPLRRVTSAFERAGFRIDESAYRWARLNTSLLGPLSPGYRVVASRAGERPANPGRVEPLPGRFEESALPGLMVDISAEFRAGAVEQIEGIVKYLGRPAATPAASART